MTGVATQGHHSSDKWVKTFTVRYKYGGTSSTAWQDYETSSGPVVRIRRLHTNLIHVHIASSRLKDSPTPHPPSTLCRLEYFTPDPRYGVSFIPSSNSIAQRQNRIKAWGCAVVRCQQAFFFAEVALHLFYCSFFILL